MQDSMLSLKDVMEHVTGRHVEEVEDAENAYTGENRLSSVNQRACEQFEAGPMHELHKAIARITRNARERNELLIYMQAKHGLERNRVMGQAAADKITEQINSAIERWGREQNPDNPPVPPNEPGQDASKSERKAYRKAAAQYTADLEAYNNQCLAIGEAFAQNSEQARAFIQSLEAKRDEAFIDYGGLTGLTDEQDIAQAEQKARQIVSDYEAKHNTQEVWNKTRAITHAMLDMMHDGGMISDRLYDRLSSQYQNYIPLRGWANPTETEKREWAYLTETARHESNPLSKAHGRSSQADNSIAYLQAAYESAIMQVNKNRLVRLPFLRFVRNHPDPLWQEQKTFIRRDTLTGEWHEVAFTPPEDATDDQIPELYEQWRHQMFQDMKQNPFDIRISDGQVPGVHLAQHLAQHQVRIMENGHPVIVTILGNPRLAMAVSGQTNPDHSDNTGARHISEVIGAANRWLSQTYTTWNPNFVAANYVRDTIYSGLITHGRENTAYAFRFNANQALLNPATIGLLYTVVENNDQNALQQLQQKLPGQKLAQTLQYFREFLDNGGETGFAQSVDLDAHKKRIERDARRAATHGLTLGKAARAIGNLYLDFNRMAENSARFATYVTSRNSGREIGRSIYDAKQVSVNFNKKGSGGKFFRQPGQTAWGNVGSGLSQVGRTMYVFWNAGVQGLYNTGSVIARHPLRSAKALLPVFIAGIASTLINGDNDDYWDLPDFVRRNNVMIKGKNGKWGSISLPIEFRTLYGLGEMAGQVCTGRYHGNGKQMARELAQLATQTLPLDVMENESDWLQNIIPSIAKPIYGIATNTAWTGNQIYYQNDYNAPMPDWTKAPKNVPGALTKTAKWFNEKTGGDDYTKGFDIGLNNPAVYEYLLQNYLGGIYQTISQLIRLYETPKGTPGFSYKNVPGISRFIKDQIRPRYDNEFRNIKQSIADNFTRLVGTVGNEQPSGSYFFDGRQEYSDKRDELLGSKPGVTPGNDQASRVITFQKYNSLITKLRGYSKYIRMGARADQEIGIKGAAENANRDLEDIKQICDDLTVQAVLEYRLSELGEKIDLAKPGPRKRYLERCYEDFKRQTERHEAKMDKEKIKTLAAQANEI